MVFPCSLILPISLFRFIVVLLFESVIYDNLNIAQHNQAVNTL
nr:MAG TPA: hypothetical protein [Caudoviricetes sp.]